jgi:hypothetical protein
MMLVVDCRLSLLLVAGWLGLLGACSKEEPAPADSDADADTDTDSDTDSDTDTGPAGPLTFTADILPILEVSCLDCHPGWGGSPDQVYTYLTTQSRDGYALITPNDPDQSYLYLKVASATPPRGAQMPLQVPNVSASELAAVRSWIEAGAANDATFRASMARVYGSYACDDCHEDWAGRNDPDGLYATLLSSTENGYPFIDPGNPDNSYVYLKIASDSPPAGDRMPQMVSPWSADRIALLQAWILDGALKD